jgi:hypothetical protein
VQQRFAFPLYQRRFFDAAVDVLKTVRRRATAKLMTTTVTATASLAATATTKTTTTKTTTLAVHMRFGAYSKRLDAKAILDTLQQWIDRHEREVDSASAFVTFICGICTLCTQISQSNATSPNCQENTTVALFVATDAAAAQRQLIQRRFPTATIDCGSGEHSLCASPRLGHQSFEREVVVQIVLAMADVLLLSRHSTFSGLSVKMREQFNKIAPPALSVKLLPPMRVLTIEDKGRRFERRSMNDTKGWLNKLMDVVGYY